MATHNISLPSELTQYVTNQIESGKYSSISELYRSALRAFQSQEEERQLKLEALRLAIAEGEKDIAEGRTTRLESSEDIHDFIKSIGQQVTAKANA